MWLLNWYIVLLGRRIHLVRVKTNTSTKSCFPQLKRHQEIQQTSSLPHNCFPALSVALVLTDCKGEQNDFAAFLFDDRTMVNKIVFLTNTFMCLGQLKAQCIELVLWRNKLRFNHCIPTFKPWGAMALAFPEEWELDTNFKSLEKEDLKAEQIVNSNGVITAIIREFAVAW